MREIVFDTETTGVDPASGDRVVEIGCIELSNYVPTGRNFHAYINPQRPMSEGAYRVHGLSDAFLADKPIFADIAPAFVAFIADSPLIAHNMSFDAGFMNMEFKRLSIPPLNPDRLIDTLLLARRKHPGAVNTLDALCARYSIDNSRRTKHGALLDAEILAEVYVELRGGRQANLVLTATEQAAAVRTRPPVVQRSKPLPTRLTEAEKEAHAEFIAKLGDKALWRGYMPE